MKKFIIFLFLITNYSYSSLKTICGYTDDRELSYDKRIARIIQPKENSGCTGTLIGKTCMISAGHCKKHLKLVEFDVPQSRNGKIMSSDPIDQYEVDPESIVSIYHFMGEDWSVFRLKPNKITNLYAGSIRGFYDICLNLPLNNDIVRITGYGIDSDPEKWCVQQTHTGKLLSILKSTKKAYYFVDTTDGNSGSAIIDEKNQKIIGVHTTGGVYHSDPNEGTIIALTEKFLKAIHVCLNYEEDYL